MNSNPLLRLVKEPTPEETIKSSTVQIERKTISLSLRQNSLGQFVRINEEAGGKFNTLIIPASGLAEFQRVLNEITKP